MRAVTGPGCNKAGAPVRSDLPLHDMTGGNTWMPDAILYQNAAGTLRLGGGLTALEISAIQAGQSRARQQLQLAASLSVAGDTLKVTNLTGHKLISGYPEGRRMWLNVKWFDASGALLREDGRYGPLAVTLRGAPLVVNSLLDPSDPNTKVYEAHYALTQAWAAQLIGYGYSPGVPVGYDEVALSPPPGASYASIDLLYQSTSWEYVQFLALANEGGNAFLADEGQNLLDAWLATGMARPEVVASAAWGTPPAPACATPGTPGGLTATAGRRSVTLAWTAASPGPVTAYRVYYDQSGKLQLRASVTPGTTSYKDASLSRNVQYCYRVASFTDCDGDGAVDAGEESAPTPAACATAQ
jgi:hypothetical protein